MSHRQPLLLLVGPTAVGKTELSLELAKALDGEIISADSMQVYRGMNIGTAKPSTAVRNTVAHHLIDILNPDERFTAAEYAQRADGCITAIFQRNRVPIVTGGTGLYVNALIDGFLFPEQGSDQQLRAQLTHQAEQDRHALFAQLRTIDPKTAERLHPNDTRRVIRAMEVYYITGQPISSLQRKQGEEASRYRTLHMGLTRDRQELYHRIDERVDAMIAQGLVHEVEGLLGAFPNQPTALQALGYKEVAGYLQGERSLSETIECIKRDTRRYAKRQLSWFRRDERIQWYNLTDVPANEVIQNILTKYQESPTSV